MYRQRSIIGIGLIVFIFVFTYLYTKLSPKPRELDQKPFDSAAWKAADPQTKQGALTRQSMFDSVPKKVMTLKSFQQASDLLGEPDGDNLCRDTTGYDDICKNPMDRLARYRMGESSDGSMAAALVVVYGSDGGIRAAKIVF